jgi:glycosyltransferase involved in cell wall biosynthesis
VRILIASGIFPPDIGGPATHVPLVARGLVARGHAVTVVTQRDGGGAPETRPYRVVTVDRAQPGWRRRLQVVRTLRRLARNADVVLSAGLEFEAVLANGALRRPLVHRVVGDRVWERAVVTGRVTEAFETFQTSRHGLRLATLRAFRSWSIRRSDRVIVPSRFLARCVAGWGVPEERLAVVRNGVEPLDGLRPEAPPLDARPRLATHARLVPWKRVDWLIDTLRSVDGAGLLVIGDGPERERLAAHAGALGVARRVCFAGRCPRAEALALVAACDLFVLPSTYEGFPHAVLEAMSLGVPVVATAVGGTVEIVTDGVNGRLVPAADPGALHEAIATTLAAPATRARLAAGGRATAARFGIDAMVAGTEAVLAEAAARGGAR